MRDELFATMQAQVLALAALVKAMQAEKLVKMHHSRLNTRWLCSKIEGHTPEYIESERMDLVRYDEIVLAQKEKETEEAKQKCRIIGIQDI